MDRIDRQVCGIETELAHYRRRPKTAGRDCILQAKLLPLGRQRRTW